MPSSSSVATFIILICFLVFFYYALSSRGRQVQQLPGTVSQLLANIREHEQGAYNGIYGAERKK